MLQQDIEPFTASLVAPEQLPQELPKLPEAVQHGHASFQFDIPKDSSGQAAPRSRGQPSAVGSTAASQVPFGAAHSASFSVPAAAAHASTAAPVPSPPVATLIPFGAVAAPIPVVGAPAPVQATDVKKVPKTTAWRRKKLAEAATAAAAQGLTPRKRQTPQQFLCQKCGQPKTKEFGHSQFRGVHFCAKTSGEDCGTVDGRNEKRGKKIEKGQNV